MGFRWDPIKSDWLKRIRGVSFEEVLRGKHLVIEDHPKRPGQKLMLFELDGYIWVVPCVRSGDDLFLKTMFPSRKFTKRWLKGERP